MTRPGPETAARPWTAGKWTVPAPKTGEDVTVEGRTPIHRNPVYIARVYGPGPLSRDVETRDANARLICAAPALAEACEALIWQLDARLIAAPDEHAQEAIDAARAALAAARGDR